jgi:hypothetical protein
VDLPSTISLLSAVPSIKNYYLEVVLKTCTLYFINVTIGGIMYLSQYNAGWMAQVRFQAVKDFPLLHSIQTDSEAHPASSPMSTGGSFPRSKPAGGMKVTTSIQCQGQEMWSYTCIPPYEVVSIISGTGTAICTAVLVA